MPKFKAEADLRDVKRAFRQLEPTFKKQIAFGVEAASEDVVRVARALVPVRFGFLKQFIVYQVSKRTGLGKVGIRDGPAPIPGKPTNSASQYPSVYGRFVHEGTKRMKGRPFMLQAAEANRKAFADHIRKATTDAAIDLHKQWLAAGGNSKKKRSA